MLLSIIVEWANTTLNGNSRTWQLLKILGDQWTSIIEGQYPDHLSTEGKNILANLEYHPELLIVSGEKLSEPIIEKIKQNLPNCFELRIEVSEGLEYYPLKNLGAKLAKGDLLLFVDSDVVPEDNWLPNLISSLGDQEIKVIMGQTYVDPTGIMGKSFALTWTFNLRNDKEYLFKPTKLHTNNLLFRSEVFPTKGFPFIGNCSRGSAALLRQELESSGIYIWENPYAKVKHSSPSNFRHFIIRALAHGRDKYLNYTDERSLRGMERSISIGILRLSRGFYKTFRYGKQVGLKFWELPLVLIIALTYYCVFIVGGILTYISPQSMALRFRV